LSNDVPSISEIILQWKDSHPKGYLGPKNLYFSQYVELLKNLKSVGYLKDSLTSEVIREIINACVPVDYKPVSKRNGWARMCGDFLRSAIVHMYPPIKNYETVTEEDLKKSTLVRAEIAPEIVQETTIPEEYERIGKELDRSIFKKLPMPEITYDPELSKLLGFDDE